MDNTMYIILDEKCDWIYNIVSDLDEAMDTARMLNDEENPMYYHYVVEEWSRHYGETWLAAWEKAVSL